jgi:hypothetical protein
MTMRPLCVLLVLLPLLAGCGSLGYKTASVSGRVTLNGQPLANAAVVFQPVAAKGNEDPGPGSGGKTDADGRYTLTVVGSQSRGAVVGKHKVLITRIPQEDSADDRPKRFKQLPEKYNKNTTLECDVPAGGTSSADFPLTEP